MDSFNHFLFLKFLFLIFNRAIVNGDCEVPRSTSPHVTMTLDAADGQNRIKLSCKDGFTAASGDSVITCLDSMWKVIDGNSIRAPIPFICKEKRCPVINPENGLVELRENLVLYSCNRGYRLEGSARAMCRLNRKKQYYINRRVPTCKKRPECKLSVTSPVSYNGSTYDGEIATFSCPENYKLIGSTNLTCNATGNWEGDLPYCELVSTCHDPGMAAYSNRDGSCCDSGMSLTYVCQSGYEYLEGNIRGTITCVGNHTWSSPKPICIPIGSAVCPNVPKENNLMIEADYRIHPDVYLPDDVLDLACVENYETNQTFLSLNCLDDGIWDYPFPVCYPIISCGRPRIPKNGKILELENKLNDGDVFPVGFEINLKCDDGYAVRSRLYKTKCVGDKWESELEDCTRIYCRDPGNPRHGFRNGNSFYVGDVVSFSCRHEYKLIGSSNVICDATGNWEGTLPYCEFYTSNCNDPGFSHYSRRVGDCCEDAGTSLTYACEDGYKSLDGNIEEKITCIGNDTWSALKPICIPIGSAVCPNIPVENNLEIDVIRLSHFDVYLAGDAVQLYCKDNYQWDQKFGTLTTFCSDNGTWTKRIPNCYPIYCDRPRTPKNGRILELEDNDQNLFPIRFELNIECDEGYVVKSGRYAIKCVDGNKWNSELEDCIPISCVGDKWESELEDCNRIYCRDPGIPRHGFRNGNSFYVGDVVSFSCRHEYKLIGSSNVICDATGNWEGTLPYCEFYTSNCNDPGFSHYSRRVGDCCEDAGTSLTYACEDGYKSLDGNIEEKITCIGNDTWSALKPICIPIGSAVCPNIPVENNLEIDVIRLAHFDVYLAGDAVQLYCKDNYQWDQKFGTLTTFCSDNGTWTKRIPNCYPIYCDRPRTPKNGRILELEDNDQNLFPIRFELNIECDKGYVVKSGRYAIKCVDGKWNSELEDCIRNSCDDPGIPNHGVRIGNSFYLGDIVSYSCNDNYTLIGSSSRICLKNGRWSGLTTVCHDRRSHCVDPGVPVNSYRIGLSFNKGDIVVYSCKNGYTMFGQNGTRQCLNNGSWSGEEIRCYEGTTTTASGKPTFSDENSSSVNVFFLLDASTSISKQHFDRAKEFIKLIISTIGISEEILGVRFGVISFSTQARVVLDVYEKNLQVAIDLIGSLRFARGGSNIMNALTKLTEVIVAESIKEPERAKSKSIAFLISDGFVTEGGFSVAIVKLLESKYNVVFQAVATGSKHNLDILKQISSRVLTLTNNHNELFNIVEKFVGRKIDFSACGLDRPDYSVEIEPRESGKRYKRSTSDLARIVGGKLVIRPWPWIVALSLHPIPEHRLIMNKFRFPFDVICSGTIIHSEWILTAAHCFSSDHTEIHKLLSTTQNWRGIAGRTNMHLSSGIEFPVNAIYSHPLFVTSNLDYNIALLKINPITFHYFIRPICLPPSFADLPKYTHIYKPKQKATIIGWGSTALRSPNDTSRLFSETHLREVEVPIQDDRICHQPLNYTVCRLKHCQTLLVTPTDRMMCTESDGVDACQGDSGGPLMQQLTTFGGKYSVRRWVQIGIINWGIGCGLKEFNSYYTNAAKLRSFIENVTQIEFENIRLTP